MVVLNCRIIISKTVIFTDLHSVFEQSMSVSCLVSGVFQKQGKRHSCRIPVKLCCSRGIWQIRTHPTSWMPAIIWDTFSGLQSRYRRPSCWRKIGSSSESWLHLGQGFFRFFKLPLVLLIHFHFKEECFRGLVLLYGRNISAQSLKKKQKEKRLRDSYVVKMSWEVNWRYASFISSFLPLSNILVLTCGMEVDRERRGLFFFP